MHTKDLRDFFYFTFTAWSMNVVMQIFSGKPVDTFFLTTSALVALIICGALWPIYKSIIRSERKDKE